jgi:hypothetical protein
MPLQAGIVRITRENQHIGMVVERDGEAGGYDLLNPDGTKLIKKLKGDDWTKAEAEAISFLDKA